MNEKICQSQFIEYYSVIAHYVPAAHTPSSILTTWFASIVFFCSNTIKSLVKFYPCHWLWSPSLQHFCTMVRMCNIQVLKWCHLALIHMN